jgi:Family of unknown function (DUF6940)
MENPGVAEPSTGASMGTPWQLRSSALSATTVRAYIYVAGQPASVAGLLDLWGRDAAFAQWWTHALAAVPFAAYCWETPPLTRATMARPFECVFVDSPALAGVAADTASFAPHFRVAAGALAVGFENLGGDALLVAPCPADAAARYAHLADFARTARAEAPIQLWRLVSTAATARMGARAIWISTAGLGVHWLHVRVDSWPKYYRHRPYADSDFWQQPAA